jgi:small subunit ribosomal protein S6
VNDYEILLLLDPDLTEEQQAGVIERTRSLVEKGGGAVERHDVWGRRKLAYEIDHKDEGWYHLLQLRCAPDTLEEIGRVLRIDDGVLRHLATRRIETAPEVPVAVGVPASEDVAESQPDPAEEE